MQIIMQGISKSFNGKVVLDNISFADNFQSMAVIGPSGAGKSTLLRIIGGLLALLPESYILTEKDYLFREGTAGLPADYRLCLSVKGLFEHLTSLDNVTLPLVHVLGISREEANENAYKLLAVSGWLERAQVSFSTVRRSAAAAADCPAVITKPKLLLLDEPTSALDPELTAEVLDMLDELQNDGLNTIIVTHEMGFAKSLRKNNFSLRRGHQGKRSRQPAALRSPFPGTAEFSK